MVQRQTPFSDQLLTWFRGKQPKTLAGLVGLFEDKGFAVAILVLMIIPATPLPTGGVTHVFELIAILLALEMVSGRQTVWLPRRWRNIDVSSIGAQRAFQRVIGWLGWVERHTKPRLRAYIDRSFFRRTTGLLIAVYCAASFLAPPFSGLDTVPSIAVVLLTLSIIFEDIVLYIVGVVAGGIGIGLVVVLGKEVFRSLRMFI